MNIRQLAHNEARTILSHRDDMKARLRNMEAHIFQFLRRCGCKECQNLTDTLKVTE